ncbi:hypothetical protein F2Q68_00006575 [Brassica cretica]|uniref:Uncharacterized protein n=1 Tax=Brassica cretica TaxID=69181 RepID=A0A8S9JEV1_BRACR|nr:hypothetical protein F2Q68_00006575 [Brassica cretica]
MWPGDRVSNSPCEQPNLTGAGGQAPKKLIGWISASQIPQDVWSWIEVLVGKANVTWSGVKVTWLGSAAMWGVVEVLCFGDMEMWSWCNRCWERGRGVVVRRDGVVVNCSSVTASFTKGVV